MVNEIALDPVLESQSDKNIVGIGLPDCKHELCGFLEQEVDLCWTDISL